MTASKRCHGVAADACCLTTFLPVTLPRMTSSKRTDAPGVGGRTAVSSERDRHSAGGRVLAPALHGHSQCDETSVQLVTPSMWTSAEKAQKLGTQGENLRRKTCHSQRQPGLPTAC